MIYLAVHGGERPCNATEICEDLDISISYLEQLFSYLRKAGFVVGVRGPGGGYRLDRPASEITVADIVMAVDDRAYVKHADSAMDFRRHERSMVQRMWGDLSTRLYQFLGSITLADCVARKGETEQTLGGRGSEVNPRVPQSNEAAI